MKRIAIILAFTMLIASVHAVDLPPAPRVSGLAGAIVSTSNLASSLEFYVGVLGCEKIGQGSLSAENTARFWPWAPKDSTASYALLKKGAKASVITIVQFSSCTGLPVRSATTPTMATGIFDVAFRTRDMEVANKSFADRGFSFLRPPFTYMASWTKSVVKEGILIGPDGLHIAFIQKVDPPAKPPLAGDFGDMTDSAQIVHSIDECADFYQEGLGLSYVGDQVMAAGELDEFLDLPAGSIVRIAFFIDLKRPEYPPVEVLEISRDGKRLHGPDLAPASRGTNVGALAITIASDDLAGSLARLSALQYRILAAPTELTLAGAGNMRFAYVEAPSRIVLRLEELVR